MDFQPILRPAVAVGGYCDFSGERLGFGRSSAIGGLLLRSQGLKNAVPGSRRFGLAPPSCMKRAQCSRIALNISSMAALAHRWVFRLFGRASARRRGCQRPPASPNLIDVRGADAHYPMLKTAVGVEKKYAKAALDRHIDGRDFFSVSLNGWKRCYWRSKWRWGLIIQFSGVDAAKYDAIVKEAGLKGKKAVWPAGIISHAAGPTADGWCVVDVWSSQAQPMLMWRLSASARVWDWGKFSEHIDSDPVLAGSINLADCVKTIRSHAMTIVRRAVAHFARSGRENRLA